MLRMFSLLGLSLATGVLAGSHIEVFGTGVVLPLPVQNVKVVRSPDASQAGNVTCGKQGGGQSCPTGSCCSQDGICGIGRYFCDAPNCQFQYGPACDANTTPAGQNTSSIPRPNLGSVSYSSAGLYNCTKPGTVALTYDDGPYIYTSSLLDELASFNASATFFITGNNYGKQGIDNENTIYPALIRRMHAQGHQIASHTWSHQNLNAITHQQRMDQMIKNEMAFRNILGFWPTYMRPPYDSCKENTGCREDMSALGYHIVEYNIDTHDYDNLTPDLIQHSKDNVSAVITPSDPLVNDYIVYAHDVHPQTAVNLTSFMLDLIKSKGYKFVTIGECLGDPAENWYRNGTTGAALGSTHSASSTSSTTSSATSSGSTNTVAGTSTASKSAAAASNLAPFWQIMLVSTGIAGFHYYT